MSSIFTVHRQPYGEVMNPISPDSVRFHDKNGNVTEVSMVDGMVNIRVGGVTVSAEYLEDLMRQMAKPPAEAQPVAWQFQDRDGKWHGFIDEQHRQNTIADGSWPVRALYTTPPSAPAAVKGLLTCYQCGKTVTWLAPDSRCGDCTRLTPDEVRG